MPGRFTCPFSLYSLGDCLGLDCLAGTRSRYGSRRLPCVVGLKLVVRQCSRLSDENVTAGTDRKLVLACQWQARSLGIAMIQVPAIIQTGARQRHRSSKFVTDGASRRWQRLAAGVGAFQVDCVHSPPASPDLIVASETPAQNHIFARGCCW